MLREIEAGNERLGDLIRRLIDEGTEFEVLNRSASRRAFKRASSRAFSDLNWT